jgi:hypothetical protein
VPQTSSIASSIASTRWSRPSARSWSLQGAGGPQEETRAGGGEHASTDDEWLQCMHAAA